ncbi:DMT family transporter [Sulfitobacter aestuariivivens]|uniref:DMT family transporter n=1 Tax=Sulfitobacter aestuariivivens TaxID=2766981 RepID=A0A927D6X7_9RHOB|nr:DMT family transporter [Sulfitobacter aestuariivivens]MBD3666049.1 DMT family transporter [Sulfitobacter aestuariivivens]
MKAPRNLTALASGLVFTSACIWGLVWWPIRFFVEQGIPGTWAVATMNLLAGAALAAFVAYDWRHQSPHLRRGILIGVLTGAAFACYFAALIHGSVIRATLLFYLTPIWATLLGIWLLGEQADWRRWSAIVLGLVGLGCLLSGDHSQPLGAADVLAVASGVLWALGGAAIKSRGDLPVAGMAMLQYLFLVLFTFGLGLALGDARLPDPALLLANLPALSAFALLVYVPAVILLFWASRILYPGRVGILMMSEVYVAILSASLLLPDERMVAVQWLGAALIIAAGVIEVFPKQGRATTAD